VDLPTRIGPSIAMERGGSNAGAGCGAADEDRGMARDYSRKSGDFMPQQSQMPIRRGG
jgi:hypothetical protein